MFADNAGNKKAGNNEKQVDPDKAALDDGGEGMKGDHQQDGDGAQAVDIGPVSSRLRVARRHCGGQVVLVLRL